MTKRTIHGSLFGLVKFTGKGKCCATRPILSPRVQQPIAPPALQSRQKSGLVICARLSPAVCVTLEPDGSARRPSPRPNLHRPHSHNRRCPTRFLFLKYPHLRASACFKQSGSGDISPKLGSIHLCHPQLRAPRRSVAAPWPVLCPTQHPIDRKS